MLKLFKKITSKSPITTGAIVGGATAYTGVTALVAVGTAGTGTALATLSGAALSAAVIANPITLAVGGVALLVTGGVAIASKKKAGK